MEGGFFMRKRLMASGLVVIMALGLMTGCNGKSSEAEKNTQSTKDSGNDNAQVSEDSEERTIQYYYDFGEINQRTWVDDVKTLQIQDDTLLILTDKTYDNKAVKKLSESIKESGNDFDIIMIKIPWEYTFNDTMADFIQYIQKNGINPDILCSNKWRKFRLFCLYFFENRLKFRKRFFQVFYRKSSKISCYRQPGF